MLMDTASSQPEEYFSFEIMPASKLKYAIGALAEPDLNSTGMARIDVNEAGFEITVRDNIHLIGEVVGFLSLNANSLIDFKCNKHLSKMIRLDKKGSIGKFMNSVGDNDAVKVFSDNGTQLSFQFLKTGDTGRAGRESMNTDFIDATLLEKFPAVSCAFEVTLSTDDMDPLLNSIMEDIFDRKAIETGEATIHKNVTIKAGMSEVTIKARPEFAWFEMTNWMALKKASRLTDTCYFYLVTNPAENIMLRYCLKELGDFVILKSTDECNRLGRQHTLQYCFGPQT